MGTQDEDIAAYKRKLKEKVYMRAMFCIEYRQITLNLVADCGIGRCCEKIDG